MKNEESFTLEELVRADKDLRGYDLKHMERVVEQAKKNRAYEDRTPVWKVTVPVTKLITTSMGEQGAVSILKTELGMRGYTTGEGTATR